MPSAMETPLPNSDKASSLNIEESRAKRLGRQQARLRDRGGIFRPENRNNSLFDILCMATHRKSPAKGRGRSRTRSVSPQKKATASNSSAKTVKRKTPVPATRKSTGTAPTIGKSEGDVDPKPRRKASKGKQKQTAETTEAEDDKTGPKSKAKKATPAQKSTTKRPRRTAKKSFPGDDPSPEGGDSPSKNQQTRSRGKRKKQDIDDDEVTEVPPPKTNGKDKSKPPVRKQAATKSRSKKPPSKGKRRLVDEDDRVSELESEKPPAKSSRPAVVDEANDRPPTPPLKIGPPKKRKAEVGVEDEARLQKRKVTSELQSESKADGESASRCKPKPVSQTECVSSALVDAINSAARNGLGDNFQRDDLGSKPIAKRLKPSKPAMPSCRNDPVGGDEPKVVSKPAKKRPRSEAEIDDEVPLVPVKLKKSKSDVTEPPQDVLQPKLAVQDKTSSSKSRPTKKTEDKEGENRPQKTASRKRKENANAAGRQAKSRSGPKTGSGRHLKGDPGIPEHVKKKLKARHDNYATDDEPDPIDFLS